MAGEGRRPPVDVGVVRVADVVEAEVDYLVRRLRPDVRMEQGEKAEVMHPVL